MEDEIRTIKRSEVKFVCEMPKWYGPASTFGLLYSKKDDIEKLICVDPMHPPHEYDRKSKSWRPI